MTIEPITDEQMIKVICAYEALSPEEIAIIDTEEHEHRLEVWSEAIGSCFPAITDRLRADAATIDSLRSALQDAERVIGVYRVAAIAAREFDEDDDEALDAQRAAYLAHIDYDPTLVQPGPFS